MKIADIPRISEIVHERCPNALIVVDNTMMSPYLQKPLELGADIVYHSGTKYLSGHHDLMAGVVAVKDDSIGDVRIFQATVPISPSHLGGTHGPIILFVSNLVCSVYCPSFKNRKSTLQSTQQELVSDRLTAGC